MKKRILKIAALVVALALIIGVCWFANGLVGNPISKAMAINSAGKHIQNNYDEDDLEIERVTFSFKDGHYHAFVTSQSNIDGDFTILIDMWGKVLIDTYEDRVSGGWNTADRIGREYRSKVDAVFDSQSFPYAEHIGYGDIEFISREYKDDPNIPNYALVTEELTMGAIYDVNELGAKAGKLTVYIDDDTVSIERMAEILLDIREIFDAAGVKFYAIDCVLEYGKDENGFYKDGRVEVMDFLYSDIYDEDMIERVQVANDAATSYHAWQDDEKFGESE